MLCSRLLELTIEQGALVDFFSTCVLITQRSGCCTSCVNASIDVFVPPPHPPPPPLSDLMSALAGKALSQAGFVKDDQILAGTNFIFSTTRHGAFTAEGDASYDTSINFICMVLFDVMTFWSSPHAWCIAISPVPTLLHCKILIPGKGKNCVSHTMVTVMLLCFAL